MPFSHARRKASGRATQKQGVATKSKVWQPKLLGMQTPGELCQCRSRTPIAKALGRATQD